MSPILESRLAQLTAMPAGATKIAAAEDLLRGAEAEGAADLAFRIRLALTEAYHFGGEPGRGLVTFVRSLRDADAAPGRFGEADERMLRRQYTWVVTTMIAQPEVPLARIEGVLDDMERWFAEPRSSRPVYALRRDLAGHRGDADGARKWHARHEEAVAADDDGDCLWCRAERTALHCFAVGDTVMGQVTWEALQVSGMLSAAKTQDGGCARQPGALLSRLLNHFGRPELMRAAHERGYAAVRGSRANLELIAPHLELCARTGNQARGMWILEQHLGWLDRPPTPLAAMEFAASAALLLRRARTGGRDVVTVQRPGGAVTADVLEAELTKLALSIAARFDERNDGAYQGDRIRRRLEPAAGPSGLPLADPASSPLVRESAVASATRTEPAGVRSVPVPPSWPMPSPAVPDAAGVPDAPAVPDSGAPIGVPAAGPPGAVPEAPVPPVPAAPETPPGPASPVPAAPNAAPAAPAPQAPAPAVPAEPVPVPAPAPQRPVAPQAPRPQPAPEAPVPASPVPAPQAPAPQAPAPQAPAPAVPAEPVPAPAPAAPTGPAPAPPGPAPDPAPGLMPRPGAAEGGTPEPGTPERGIPGSEAAAPAVPGPPVSTPVTPVTPVPALPEPGAPPAAPAPPAPAEPPAVPAESSEPRRGADPVVEEQLRRQASAAHERGDLGESAATLMRLGLWLEQRDRGADAAEVFASAAALFEARGDRFSAVRAHAIQASNLYAAGRREAALQVLADADQIARRLPDRENGPPPADRAEAEEMRLGAESRAVLNVHTAFILGREGRYQEAIGRSYAAIGGFRAIYQQDEAERATVLAAQVSVAAGGPISARQALRELLAGLTPGGDAHAQVGQLLVEVEKALAEDPEGRDGDSRP